GARPRTVRRESVRFVDEEGSGCRDHAARADGIDEGRECVGAQCCAGLWRNRTASGQRVVLHGVTTAWRRADGPRTPPLLPARTVAAPGRATARRCGPLWTWRPRIRLRER